MKASVYSNEMLIGTVWLLPGDVSMGCAYGEFNPTEYYFKEIQKSVWEFWSANQPDYAKWNSLRLNVQLENGCFLFAAGGITIDDIEELPGEPLRIDLAGLDRNIIEYLTMADPWMVFVEEPWETITVGQKIGFEDELRKELGIYESNGNIFRLFKSATSTKHILTDFEISAVCRKNDDVLFSTRKIGVDDTFAVVHLTWRGSKESGIFPSTQFYSDFDDFKYNRMRPDKIEWEC